MRWHPNINISHGTVFDRILRLVVKYARGRELGALGGIAPRRALVQIIRRGAAPLLRGAIVRLWLGKATGPLFIGRNVRILAGSQLTTGRSVFIGDFSYINCYSLNGVRLGNGVTLREFAWLQLTSDLDEPGDRVEIGDGTYIGPRSTLGAAAPLIIGNRCQVGANVSFIAESHLFAAGREIYGQGVSRRGISVGDDCWIGNNVIILDGVEIGEGTVIGAGAVVTKSIPPKCIAVGMPARVIRSR
jgi:acetyltransferase-like isoleucine patch superfamily enzyme